MRRFLFIFILEYKTAQNVTMGRSSRAEARREAAAFFAGLKARASTEPIRSNIVQERQAGALRRSGQARIAMESCQRSCGDSIFSVLRFSSLFGF